MLPARTEVRDEMSLRRLPERIMWGAVVTKKGGKIQKYRKKREENARNVKDWIRKFSL
jgi:hypothetical protein